MSLLTQWHAQAALSALATLHRKGVKEPIGQLQTTWSYLQECDTNGDDTNEVDITLYLHN